MPLVESLASSSSPQEQVVTLIGYSPTVQALCVLLGDVLAIPNVQILRECVRVENKDRCQAFLQHGLLFKEELVSMVDFLDSLDMLHQRIDTPEQDLSDSVPPANKYVVDCGRGLCLMKYGWVHSPYRYCMSRRSRFEKSSVPL